MAAAKNRNDEEEKKKITAIISSVWGGNVDDMFEKYYKNKTYEECYASALKLLTAYYGESTAKKLLEGPVKDKTEAEKLAKNTGSNIKYLIFLGTYGVLITLVYLFRVGGEDYNPHFVNLITVLTPLIPIIFGYVTIKYFGLKSMHGKSIMLLTIGLALWLIADTYWIFDSTIPSVADLFYLTGYIFFAASFIYSIRIVDPNYDFFKDKSKVFLMATSIVLGIIVYMDFFTITWDSNISVIKNIVTTGYVLADALLIIILFIIIGIVFVSRYNLVWILILIATTLVFIADVLYGINYSDYDLGDNLDLLWYFSYLTYASAIIFLKSITEKSIQELSIQEKK